LRIVPVADDFREKIAQREIQAVLEIPDDFDERISRGEAAELRIFTYVGDSASRIAADRLERILRAERAQIVRERLAEEGLSDEILRPFSVVQANVAPPEKVTGALLGGILPYVLIMICITGAIYPALDLTAGEKERGTMETLLSSPVPRSILVFGKFGVVLTFSLASGFLAVTALGGSFWVALSQLEAPGQLGELALNPVSIAAFFLLLIPMAALFSALLLVFSLFARNFREAQTYVGPLMIAAILPAAVAVIPGVELTAPLALLPVLNVSLIGRDLLSGIYPWGLIGLILVSSSLYAALALWLAVKLFQKEAVIFRE
ncbi:MAG TPA: ABC transporter permease, partial [Opitutales bacterium]|nr:ABC transporter permease [Opitutales bacterium]